MLIGGNQFIPCYRYKKNDINALARLCHCCVYCFSELCIYFEFTLQQRTNMYVYNNKDLNATFLRE